MKEEQNMANVALSSKAVGSTIKLKVDGTPREFIIVHQGKPSSLYDASCDGTWLLLKDMLETRQWHSSNSNSYKASTIHSYLNNEWLNKLVPDTYKTSIQINLLFKNMSKK